MLTKKVVIPSIFFLLLACLALIFRPVPNPSPENTIKTNGTIEEVSMAGDDDIIIKLRGDDRLYFIDEGLKDGRSLSTLQGELSGKSVEIQYVKFWTPLDPLSKLKHISKVNVDQTRLYPAVE
jgi:hypothetical protein